MPGELTDRYQSTNKNREEIQVWLVEQVAGLLYVDPKTIDVTMSFNSFGLSSRDAVMLSGDLEEWLDRRLSPTLLYEYPTITELAVYLSSEQDVKITDAVTLDPSNQEPDGSGPVQAVQFDGTPAAEQALNLRLADLEQLSDDEAEALLLDKLNKLRQ